MRIGIIGAGAVGGFMAGQFARAGQEVTILARGENLAAIKANGLTVETQGEKWTSKIEASDDPADLGLLDLAIITAKAPALPTLSALIEKNLKPETTVIAAMNGIPWWYEYLRDGKLGGPLERVDPGAKVWNILRPERAVGCVIDCPARVIAPGHVAHVAERSSSFRLGEPSGEESDRVRNVAELISSARMKAPVTNDIRKAIWAKLIINLSRSPIGVLTGASERGMAENKDTLALTLAMMREGAAVAASHGITLEVDEARQSDPAGRSEHRSSMLQDWDLGRPMEIDGIVRIVQDFARAAGIATPTIDTVSALLVAKAQQAGTYS